LTKKKIHSKRKGALGELVLSKLIQQTFGIDARRGQQYCGNADSHDIHTSLPINFECKRTERLNLEAALDQAESECHPGTVPVVVSKKNKKDWVLSVRWSHLVELINILAPQIKKNAGN